MEFRKRKQEFNDHLYKYFDPEIMPMLWELPTVEMPDGTLDKEITRENLIEKFRTDLDGFFKDPESKLMIESCKGVDRELARTYKDDIERLLQIMDLLRMELNKIG